MVEDLLQQVPVFALVFFRLAGLMLYAPLFGSSRIPRRVRVLLTMILAFGVCGGIKRTVPIPDAPWQLAIGIGGEMAFGLAMGMVMSFVFIAVQWAGEMIGQQMGFNLSEVFDPQFGAQGSLVGDMFYMLSLVVFLTIGGHHAMLYGIRASFDKLPLLSLGIDKPLFDMLVGLFQASTTLALRLASPMLVTMLVVDLALGLIGRTIPQFNVMQAGMSVRSMIGMVVVIAGLTLTTYVIENSIFDSMNTVHTAWTTPMPR
jgi:flagellar biosynthetic protein FliR